LRWTVRFICRINHDAYETMQGSTSDKTTLKDFLAKIEKMYGKSG
jgi:hypothetical protein